MKQTNLEWSKLLSLCSKFPIILVGLGISYALAQLIAIHLRREGLLAFALEDDKHIQSLSLKNLKMIRISRSGNEWSGIKADILISEKPDDQTHEYTWHIKSNSSLGIMSDLQFALSVIELFELSSNHIQFMNLETTNLILLDDSIDPINTLIRACEFKGILIPYQVYGIDHFGHGAHATIYNLKDLTCLLISDHIDIIREIKHWFTLMNCKLNIIKTTTTSLTSDIFDFLIRKTLQDNTMSNNWHLSNEKDQLRYQIYNIRKKGEKK
jgi:hypothetical protein